MSSVEDIGQIVSYPYMLSRFYLPMRHDEVAKTFLYSLHSYVKKYIPDKKIALSNGSEYISNIC